MRSFSLALITAIALSGCASHLTPPVKYTFVEIGDDRFVRSQWMGTETHAFSLKMSGLSEEEYVKRICIQLRLNERAVRTNVRFTLPPECAGA